MIKRLRLDGLFRHAELNNLRRRRRDECFLAHVHLWTLEHMIIQLRMSEEVLSSMHWCCARKQAPAESLWQTNSKVAEKGDHKSIWCWGDPICELTEDTRHINTQDIRCRTFIHVSLYITYNTIYRWQKKINTELQTESGAEWQQKAAREFAVKWHQSDWNYHCKVYWSVDH